jgi:hypothetical protein
MPLTAAQRRAAEDQYELSGLKSMLNKDIGVEPTNQSIALRAQINEYKVLEETDSRKLKEGRRLCGILHTYDQAYNDIITPLTGSTSNLPTNVIDGNIQTITDEIENLTAKYDDLVKDQRAAVIRDQALRSGNGAVTNHQIYLLGRPLRPASIPYLWALTVLFTGFALLIFYTFYPYTMPDIEIILFDLYLLFSDPFTWAILFSIASVVILFLSLRIANIL